MAGTTKAVAEFNVVADGFGKELAMENGVHGETRPDEHLGNENRVAQGDVSLFQVATVLLRHWALFVGLVTLVAGLVVAETLLSPVQWTASTSFISQAISDGPRSQLSTLASQIGFDTGAPQGVQGPEFYRDLVTSRTILAEFVSDTFSVQDNPRSRDNPRYGTLADLLEIDDNAEPDLLRAEVISWLRDRAISAAVDGETGLVRVKVRTPWADLSSQIASRILTLLNEFNLETRQSKAGAQRRFVEARLGEAAEDLRAAEQRLQTFLQNNRAFANSPELAFEHDRLQRQVAMRQQLFTSLAQSYEQARLEEVRNTPVLTVVESAEPPVRPDPRRPISRAVFGVMLGGIAGLFAVFGTEYVQRSRRNNTDDFVRFQQTWSELTKRLSG